MLFTVSRRLIWMLVRSTSENSCRSTSAETLESSSRSVVWRRMAANSPLKLSQIWFSSASVVRSLMRCITPLAMPLTRTPDAASDSVSAMPKKHRNRT